MAEEELESRLEKHKEKIQEIIEEKEGPHERALQAVIDRVFSDIEELREETENGRGSEVEGDIILELEGERINKSPEPPVLEEEADLDIGQEPATEDSDATVEEEAEEVPTA